MQNLEFTNLVKQEPGYEFTSFAITILVEFSHQCCSVLFLSPSPIAYHYFPYELSPVQSWAIVVPLWGSVLASRPPARQIGG